MGDSEMREDENRKGSAILHPAGEPWQARFGKPQSGPKVTIMAMGQVGLDAQIAAVGNVSESP